MTVTYNTETTLEVAVRHRFATYEEWWRWERERLKAGSRIIVEKECDDCEQLVLGEE